jgi:hypothetical protein
MHWFRWNHRWTTYAALFALSLQLVISFGHVHFHGLVLGSSTTAPKASEPAEPAGTVPDREKDCAICAIIGLAGTPLVPDAPALVFAVTQRLVLHSDLVAILVSDHTRAQFQARAPPA